MTTKELKYNNPARLALRLTVSSVLRAACVQSAQTVGHRDETHVIVQTFVADLTQAEDARQLAVGSRIRHFDHIARAIDKRWHKCAHKCLSIRFTQ